MRIPKPSKILVTGAAGLLASKLVYRLDSHKLMLTDVVEIDSNCIGEFPAAEFQIMDICDIDQVRNVFCLFRPDVVLHLAAFTDVAGAEKDRELCHKINVRGANILSRIAAEIRAARGAECYFVYISTDYVFDGERDYPSDYDGKRGLYSEKDCPNPINYYAETKLMGEKIFSNHNNSRNYLIIRTSFKPVPFEHPQAPTDMWTSAGYVDQIGPEIALAVDDYEFVRDYLYESGRPSIIHIAQERKSVFELAQKTNLDVKPITRADIPVRLPKDTSLDISLWQEISRNFIRS